MLPLCAVCCDSALLVRNHLYCICVLCVSILYSYDDEAEKITQYERIPIDAMTAVGIGEKLFHFDAHRRITFHSSVPNRHYEIVKSAQMANIKFFWSPLTLHSPSTPF